MTTLFNRVPPAGDDPRSIATELNRVIEYLEAQARIYAGATEIAVGPAVVDQWGILPIRSLLGGVTTIDFRLGTAAEQDRLIYEGSAPRNIEFLCSVYIFEETSVLARHDLGIRKNGDDGTIVPLLTSLGRPEFASPYIGILDMQFNDYAELVMRVGSTDSASATTQVYARHSGFLVQ